MYFCKNKERHMKRFLKFNEKDKQFVKMINQTDTSFELVILSNKLLNEILQTINSSEQQGDSINIVWQMKFKNTNYILYKNCQFSVPMSNEFTKIGEQKPTQYGQKFKITCSGASFYTNNQMFINQQVVRTTIFKRKITNATVYKDGKLLERMVKIGQLNLIQK
jgi:hypothetical protein